ncbi:hypothetical protein ACLBWT_19145 [Paenibacillus sp. D51F]
MARQSKPRARVSGIVLARTASSMLPLYARFVRSRPFAEEWSAAVRAADLDTLLKLFREEIPLAPVNSFSTNGIGFFVDFKYPPPVQTYTNATTIPPGTAQSAFSAAMLRRLSEAVLPLYRQLAGSGIFAREAAVLIRSGQEERFRRLIRPYVRSRHLTGIHLESFGFYMSFQYPGSKHIYRNEFFHEKFQ